MKLVCRVFVLNLLLFACKPDFPPKWLDDLPYDISTDGNAIIYQVSEDVEDTFQTSLYSWIRTPLGTGGSGIFNISHDGFQKVDVNWESDSIITIYYSKEAKIIHQEDSAYFAGRTILINYAYLINKTKN